MNVNDTVNYTLIREITDLIDTLNNYVLGMTNQPVSKIDILTLVSAILAVIVSSVSIYVTNKVAKNNVESNQKIANQVQSKEDKRAKAAIDANLTANARIEWIQNVRQATAELITTCYRYIWSEPDEQRKNWEAAQEKKALFVLYFGPDGESSAKSNTSHLDDIETNKSKNNLLVLFIEELFLGLEKYHSYHSYLKDFRKELGKCNSCYFHNLDAGNCMQEVYKCEKDEYGTKFTEEDCKAFEAKQEKAIRFYEEYERNLFLKLRELSEIMRIYLKIEWNRAKEGK